jgi:hypothetical protein
MSKFTVISIDGFTFLIPVHPAEDDPPRPQPKRRRRRRFSVLHAVKRRKRVSGMTDGRLGVQP